MEKKLEAFPFSVPWTVLRPCGLGCRRPALATLGSPLGPLGPSGKARQHEGGAERQTKQRNVADPRDIVTGRELGFLGKPGPGTVCLMQPFQKSIRALAPRAKRGIPAKAYRGATVSLFLIEPIHDYSSMFDETCASCPYRTRTMTRVPLYAMFPCFTGLGTDTEVSVSQRGVDHLRYLFLCRFPKVIIASLVTPKLTLFILVMTRFEFWFCCCFYFH